MKVKVGELKTHLSSYLRKVEETGEPVEVCVRERTVAYLTPAHTVHGNEEELLRRRLLEVGIAWDGKGKKQTDLLPPEPQIAGDGRVDVETVREMREGRDW